MTDARMGGAATTTVTQREFNQYRSGALPLVSWTASEIPALAAQTGNMAANEQSSRGL